MNKALDLTIKTSAQLAEEQNKPIPTGSTSITLLTLIKAMDEFNQEYKGDWSAVNPEQKAFLEHCYPYIKQLHRYSENELFGKVSGDYQVLNSFLQEHGFTIQLNPFGPESIGIVAILKLLLKWQEVADTSTITYNNKEYPAVKMNSNIGLYISPAAHQPILAIKPDKKDTLVMMMPADSRYEGLHLFFKIQQLLKGIKRMRPDDYDKLEAVFPMINMNNEADISWLVNMEKGDEWTVSQALQQNKLEVNQFGAKAESATAIVMTRGFSETYHYVIDQPFFFFTIDMKTRFPTFIAYLEPDSWQDSKEE